MSGQTKGVNNLEFDSTNADVNLVSFSKIRWMSSKEKSSILYLIAKVSNFILAIIRDKSTNRYLYAHMQDELMKQDELKN